jgi:hypothetical protein
LVCVCDLEILLLFPLSLIFVRRKRNVSFAI